MPRDQQAGGSGGETGNPTERLSQTQGGLAGDVEREAGALWAHANCGHRYVTVGDTEAKSSSKPSRVEEGQESRSGL